MRKMPVRLTEDMKHKVAREYAVARKNQKRKICSRYNISTSSASSWVKIGYGKNALLADSVVPTMNEGDLIVNLMKSVKAGEDHMLITLRLVYANKLTPEQALKVL